MQRRIFLSASLGAFAVGSAGRAQSSAAFAGIANNGQPLKAAFNAEAHDVRILMLVSPT